MAAHAEEDVESREHSSIAVRLHTGTAIMKIDVAVPQEDQN